MKDHLTFWNWKWNTKLEAMIIRISPVTIVVCIAPFIEFLSAVVVVASKMNTICAAMDASNVLLAITVNVEDLSGPDVHHVMMRLHAEASWVSACRLVSLQG